MSAPLFDIIDRIERDSRSTHPRRPVVKRIRDTSMAAFLELVPTLGHRERAALLGLRGYIARQLEFPTAYELAQDMIARGEAFDLNSVRPRLTNLADRGAVVMTDKRKCRISGKLAHTWRLPTFVTVDWMKGTASYAVQS